MLENRLLRYGVALFASAILNGLGYFLSSRYDILGTVFVPGFVLAAFVFLGGVHGGHPGTYIIAAMVLNVTLWFLAFLYFVSFLMRYSRLRRM